MSRPLALVTPDAPETVAGRIRSLQAEAVRLARDEAADLGAMIRALHAKAAEIHAGGDAYPSGVRALARDLMRDLESRGQTLEAVTARLTR